MSTDTLKAEIAHGYGTPAVVIDLDRVERNIARVQQLCDAAGVANRPHIKTHKSPVLAKLQMAAGAKGITCQKLGEAEVMVEGGLDDILISYNLLGAEKLGRLGRLLQRASVKVAADNLTVISDLPQAAEIAERQLGVVIEGSVKHVRDHLHLDENRHCRHRDRGSRCRSSLPCSSYLRSNRCSILRLGYGVSGAGSLRNASVIKGTSNGS